jgi:protein SCO1/2
MIRGVAGVLLWAVASAAAAPAPGTPAWAEGADVVEHLGTRLPLDLTFVEAGGQPTPLRALFDGTHPVVLVLAYAECPQLCSLVLDGTVSAIRTLAARGFTLGTDYRIATISFDGHEHADAAARRKARVLDALGAPGGRAAGAAWPFLVGDDASIASVTRALGFTFLRDPRTGALAHAAVVFVLTPDGVIARYLYGVEPPPRDLKLALLEAAGGKIGSFGDKILLRCFHYDPATRRYGLFIARFLQLGGLVIFAGVLVLFAYLIRHERRRARGEPS